MLRRNLEKKASKTGTNFDASTKIRTTLDKKN